MYIDLYCDASGAITLIDVLDYDASVDRREYRLTIRATDIDTGAYSEAIVQMRLQVTKSGIIQSILLDEYILFEINICLCKFNPN